MFANLSRVFGWGFLPLALAAKLPFAMSVVAVMTAVSAVRGSFTLAGTTAALVGLGTALLGPLFGAAADRWGQRPVLLATAAGNTAALLGLAFALRAEAPTTVVLIMGFLIGCTAPQTSSMVRTRWLHAIRADFQGADAQRTTSVVLSYESMTDELVFVFGPVITGFVAVLLGVVVPLEFAAGLTALGVTALAFHPSVRYVQGRAAARAHVQTAQHAGPDQPMGLDQPTGLAQPTGLDQPTEADQAVRPETASDPVQLSEHTAAPAPVRALLDPAVLLPVAGMLSIGAFFGASLTSLTSFMEQFGQADATGIYYGIMGVGSAACAMAVVLLPDSLRFVIRWLLAAALALAGSLLLIPADSLGLVVPALIIMGCGIGPALVTLYSIASEAAPQGRTTTVMAMMATGVVVGQSGASAVTGAVIDSAGFRQGFLLSCAALACLLLFALAELVLSARRRS